ncbi:UNVERIFIED_CONTAM: hypothetical protein FKN15_068253 [Acipenser sinensis]
MESDRDTITPRTVEGHGTIQKSHSEALREVQRGDRCRRQHIRWLTCHEDGLVHTRWLTHHRDLVEQNKKMADRSHGDLSNCSSKGSERSYRDSDLTREQWREARGLVRAHADLWVRPPSERGRRCSHRLLAGTLEAPWAPWAALFEVVKSNGTDSWEAFYCVFEAIREANGWTEQEKGAQLVAAQGG